MLGMGEVGKGVPPGGKRGQFLLLARMAGQTDRPRNHLALKVFVMTVRAGRVVGPFQIGELVPWGRFFGDAVAVCTPQTLLLDVEAMKRLYGLLGPNSASPQEADLPQKQPKTPNSDFSTSLTDAHTLPQTTER